VEFPSWKATRGQYLAKVFLSYRGMRSCDTVRKSFHVFAGIAESRGDRGLAQVLSIEIPTPISCDKPLKVGFDLPLESDIRLALYDAIGRRKATVAQGRFPAGRYISSTAVSGPGVWYIRIELQSPGRGPRTLTRKVVVAE
jgi:hypothetical protein